MRAGPEKIRPTDIYLTFKRIVDERISDRSKEVDFQLLQRLVELGFDFGRNWHYFGAIPCPALHAAVSLKDKLLTRSLLDLGADVNFVNTEFQDAVSFAFLSWKQAQGQDKDDLKECIELLVTKRKVLLFKQLSTELFENSRLDDDLVALICSKYVGKNLSKLWMLREDQNVAINATVFALQVRNINTSYLSSGFCPGWTSDTYLSLQIHVWVIIWLHLKKGSPFGSKLLEFLEEEICAVREALLLERDGYYLKETGVPLSVLRNRVETRQGKPSLLVCSGWKDHCIHVEFQSDDVFVFNAGTLSDHHKAIKIDNSLDTVTFKCNSVADMVISLLEARWNEKSDKVEGMLYPNHFGFAKFKDSRNAPIQQQANNCVVQSYIFGCIFRVEKIYPRAWKDLLNMLLPQVARFERSDFHLRSTDLPLLLTGALSPAEKLFPGHLCKFADVCRLEYAWRHHRLNLHPIQEVIVLSKALNPASLTAAVQSFLKFDNWHNEVIADHCDEFCERESRAGETFDARCILALIRYRSCVAKVESRLFSSFDVESSWRNCLDLLDECLSHKDFEKHQSLESFLFYYKGIVSFYLSLYQPSHLRSAIEFTRAAISRFKRATAPPCFPTPERFACSLGFMLLADNEPELCVELLGKFRLSQAMKMHMYVDVPNFARDLCFGLSYKMLGRSHNSIEFFNLSKVFLQSAKKVGDFEEVEFYLTEVENAISGFSVAPEESEIEETNFIKHLDAVYGFPHDSKSIGSRGGKRDRQSSTAGEDPRKTLKTE